MKILSLKFGGIGRFLADVEIPIAALGDAQLVGVVGENGAGKTTAMECVPAAIWRSTPSRGPIQSMANRRDSFLEMKVDLGGDVLTTRLLIDGIAKAKTTEAYLLGADGEPLTSGKARDFDAEAAKRFPAYDVFLASAFASQNKAGDFLSLPASQRKELFARLLGLGRLQEMSDAAGEKLRGVEVALAGLRSRAETLRETAGKREDLAGAVEQARQRHEFAAASREDGEHLVSTARAAVDAWKARASELDQEVTRAEASHREALGQRNHIVEGLSREQDRLTKLGVDSALLEARLGERAELEAAVAAGVIAQHRLAEVEQLVAKALHDRDTHNTALTAWRQQRVEAERDDERAREALERAEHNAGGLDGVPCKGEGEYAGCALIATAAKARAELPALQASLESARRRLEGLPPEPAGTVPDTRQLEAERAELTRRTATSARAEAKLEALRDAERRKRELDGEAAVLRGRIATARDEFERCERTVSKADEALQTARAAVQTHVTTRPESVDEAALARLRAAETAAAAELARAEQALATAEQALGELTAVEAGVAATAADVDDWRHLQQALGRNGVQALEIDAAGPEVSDLCNELLHACYGSRFSVSLETTALKADGKGTKEVFDLRVIDTERGVEGSADQLSGGEKVLVSEALALAIAIYNARRSSVPMLDLFRDEVAGALSHGNSFRYVEMLRRALDMGGFHRCWFVAHQPHLWELADSILLFEDGTCRLADEGEIVITSSEQEEAA